MMDEMEPKKEEKIEGPNEHEVRHWVDTIIQAEEIKLDEKKMKHVGPELEKRKLALDKIAPVRSIADLRKKQKMVKE